ncbi:MAG TPA: hypothetical protein VFA65_05500 [Bryobacteraceae bacterium]|nr:hypothetical protein [Bryobacteraceae bacterium]
MPLDGVLALLKWPLIIFGGLVAVLIVFGLADEKFGPLGPIAIVSFIALAVVGYFMKGRRQLKRPL